MLAHCPRGVPNLLVDALLCCASLPVRSGDGRAAWDNPFQGQGPPLVIRVDGVMSALRPLMCRCYGAVRCAAHSITSSARASSVGGTSRPSASAVFE